MEQKHTMTIILSCILVCALIFFGRLAQKEDTDPQTDPAQTTTPTLLTPVDGTAVTTNFWDFLREQDAATATTTALLTDENGNFVTTAPATDENGNFVTEPPAEDGNGGPAGSSTADPFADTGETTTTMPVFLAPVS